MAATKRKLTQAQVARFCAIRNAKKAREGVGGMSQDAANDNVQSAYVATKMTPGMLAACVAAAGFEG